MSNAANGRDLDARKQTILRAVIVEYVQGAEPIASDTLAQKYELGVKSATIRNELAEITELGYMEQPHTSAGRIPSDLGYRYFVDRLIVERDPGAEAKQTVQSVTSDGEALQEVLRDTTRALSRLTHLLAAAATFRDPSLTIRSAVISAIGPKQALVVLVLSNGDVVNRMVECPPGLSLEDLGMANSALNAAVANKPLRQVSRLRTPTESGSHGADALLANLWPLLKAWIKERSRVELITSGEEFLFSQPEFHRDLNQLITLVDELKDGDVLVESLTGPLAVPQKVTIGKEHRHERMHALSVVRQSFYVGQTEAGMIAIVGPTRMAYEEGIPLVTYTARALTASLTKYLADEVL